MAIVCQKTFANSGTEGSFHKCLVFCKRNAFLLMSGWVLGSSRFEKEIANHTPFKFW